MPLSATQLTQLGERFLSSMNARDYASAASTYADDATYESASLLDNGFVDGRIIGRDQIIEFFTQALEGDDDFQLTPLDVFTGLNLAVMLSSTEGKTFVDVLRFNDDGLITEHLEVSPKASHWPEG